MKLLLFTRFHPAIGGLETVMEILASEWITAGHEVRVATDVPASPSGQEPPFFYEVHHQPDPRRLSELVKWCDAYVQGCIGLKTLWPLAIYRRLYVASHQTWYQRGDGSRGWPDCAKQQMARFAVNIAPSHAIADHLSAPCVVIPNPYRSEIFKRLPGSVQDRELIFVGRLVSDKGANLLLQALSGLRKDDLRPRLTIVGDGPERSALEREAIDLDLDEQVVFAGSQPPSEVAILLNRHRVLVVPSIWQEPFGVVALEGIACGCLVIGSEGGGLKDAIGPCGFTFPNGDVAALTERLKMILQSKKSLVRSEDIHSHLARHQPTAIAVDYICAMVAATSR